MKYRENIQAVERLEPDFMGFIFYEKSPRVVEKVEADFNNKITKVGVFVEPDAEKIIAISQKNKLHWVQLHGEVSLQELQKIKSANITVIKAVGIGGKFDFQQLIVYEPVVDYFLFDTQSSSHGGTGVSFNWEILKQYNLSKPIFLAGGVGLDNLTALVELSRTIPIYAIDMNSRLEDAPAVKNIEKVKKAIEIVREY